MVRHRLAILVTAAALAGAGAIIAACSSASGGRGFDADDAGHDATVDAPAPRRDSGGPADAAPDVRAVPDSAPAIEAGCSPINTACDIVAQDCPPDDAGAAQECRASGKGTVCVAPSASQRLPKGHACCPNASVGPDPCGPGLRCIGLPDDPCTADAGLTGRCSPACCADDVCGVSDPEGFAGRCSLHIVDSNDKELFMTCDYDAPCQLFHVAPCASGFTCIVGDKFGTSTCVPIFNGVTDGGPTSVGLPEGAPCQGLNACADGLTCVAVGDAGASCAWICLSPGAQNPFDAGALTDAAGHGGCPPGESCKYAFAPSDPLPGWFAFCGK